MTKLNLPNAAEQKGDFLLFMGKENIRGTKPHKPERKVMPPINYPAFVGMYAEVLGRAGVPDADIAKLAERASGIDNAKKQHFAQTVQKVTGVSPSPSPYYFDVNANGLSWEAGETYREQGSTMRDLEFPPSGDIFQANR